MGDTTRAAQFLHQLDLDRKEAIAEVGAAAEAMRVAKLRYEDAVLHAHRIGVTNTAMALAAKRTETAIRLFIKRKTGK